jgi:hypothetical protein
MSDIIDVTHIRLLALATPLHPAWDELRAELRIPDDDDNWTLIGLQLIEARVRYRVPKRSARRSRWRPAGKRRSATERRNGRSRRMRQELARENAFEDWFIGADMKPDESPALAAAPGSGDERQSH